MMIRPDRVVRWLDSEGFEVKTNPVHRFVLRQESEIVSEVHGVPIASGAESGAESTARRDLDDTSVVDVASTSKAKCPGKNNPAFLILFWAFPRNENLTSLLCYPQLRFVSDRQERWSWRWRFRVSAALILISAERTLSTTLTDRKSSARSSFQKSRKLPISRCMP
jgi:hypothetical protein